MAKYILAGTTATVSVELASHFIDTMNMRSKIVDSQTSVYEKQQKKSLVRRLFRKENLRGYQLVIHGYFFSCLVFFGVQYKGKELTAENINPNLAVIQTFLASLIGTAFAELAALPLYYPYDLIKVRMQTSQAKYGYKNFIDGIIKMYHQSGYGLSRIRNFYSGASYYGLAYIIFISLEFAIHDMLIE